MSSLEDMLNSAFSTNENDPSDVYNPYMEMELDDLLKVASAEKEKVASANHDPAEVLDPASLDELGGQIMAHAMFQEFDFIREKVASGTCRVCKENPMDVRGSSICSNCLESDDE